MVQPATGPNTQASISPVESGDPMHCGAVPRGAQDSGGTLCGALCSDRGLDAA